ncbi:hypothetical protein HH308_28225 [Gordonia sp. TBRC 11910]|uniref:Uncharacterized protein n=1 Tax=Gordonia asplenii TaxID=2725283 RepID=A0A848L3V3_9ACTN|nr:hypothetical protein [Gordonia asplenii]NMO05112.1 hypothetical protein [Gordonia asplenii]
MTGFAALGAVVSLIAIAGQELWSGPPISRGGAFYTSLRIDWAPSVYVETAAIGAALGAGAGVFLWVIGLRMSGAAGNRIARVVAAGLFGTTVGLSPTLILLAGAFADAHWARGFSSTATILAVYAVSGVLGYCTALAAVYLVLRAGDAPSSTTVKVTAAFLPVGAISATLIGVGAAYRMGYSTTTSTWVVVVTLVVSMLAATFAAARSFALRRRA